MQASNDSFVVTVYDEFNVVRDVLVPVSVRPLVLVSPLRVVPDSQAVIGPVVLDASQLAVATKSNPVFRIVRSSRLGFVSQRLGSGGGGGGGGGGWVAVAVAVAVVVTVTVLAAVTAVMVMATVTARPACPPPGT